MDHQSHDMQACIDACLTCYRTCHSMLMGHCVEAGGDRRGEALVDPLVGLPPLAVEVRGDDDVVVDRPQCVVAEALVVGLQLVLGERHGVQPHAGLGEGGGSLAGLAGPPDPGTLAAAHHRLHRGDEAAGAAPPLGAAVGEHLSVDRQAVRGDDEVVRPGGRRGVHRGRSPSGRARVARRAAVWAVHHQP